MAEAIVMPKLGLTMQTGTVTEWNVSEGQRVTAGAAVAEITTEKITYVLEAPTDGVLLRVVVPVDGEAPIGATIGIFGQPGDDIASLLEGATGRHADAAAPAALEAAPGPGPAAAASPPPGPPTADDGRPIFSAGPGARVPASPAAKKRAAELGIDLALVSGTGPGGRVTIDDVNLAAEREAALPVEVAVTTAVPEVLVSAAASRPEGAPAATSWTVSAPTTHFVWADAYALVELVATFNAHRQGRDDISVTAAMVKAVAATLREMPRMASRVDGEVTGEGGGIDVGVAVAGPGGVTAVVVRGAGAMTLGEVSREIAAATLRTQEAALRPNEMLRGTFTVADMSGYATVDWPISPVSNPGEAAILAVGRIVDDVAAIAGSLTVRPTVGLSLTFDQRAIDPASAADFLALLLDQMAHPARMLV